MPEYAVGGLIVGFVPVCGGAVPCTCPASSCLYRVEVGERAWNPLTGVVQEWDGSQWVRVAGDAQ